MKEEMTEFSNRYLSENPLPPHVKKTEDGWIDVGALPPYLVAELERIKQRHTDDWLAQEATSSFQAFNAAEPPS